MKKRGRHGRRPLTEAERLLREAEAKSEAEAEAKRPPSIGTVRYVGRDIPILADDVFDAVFEERETKESFAIGLGSGHASDDGVILDIIVGRTAMTKYVGLSSENIPCYEVCCFRETMHPSLVRRAECVASNTDF